MAGSPCIDAGNPEGINKNALDLDGNPRIMGSAIDIGSYETFTVSTMPTIKSNAGIKIYPNPVEDILHFELAGTWSGAFDMLIYNSAGLQVYSSKNHKAIHTQLFEQNVSTLAPGQYDLVIKNVSTTASAKLIVQ